VKFHELTIEERAEWRNDPVTIAAIDALRDNVRVALGDLISHGRGDSKEKYVYMSFGRHEMAERILKFLGAEDR
jgi:hypothetical protein